MFNQLGVIGCGLMGGSFALALKRSALVRRVVERHGGLIAATGEPGKGCCISLTLPPAQP